MQHVFINTSVAYLLICPHVFVRPTVRIFHSNVTKDVPRIQFRSFAKIAHATV